MAQEEFTRYAAIVSQAAEQLLGSAAPTPLAGSQSLVLGAPAARLLLRDDVALHALLPEGLVRLAEIAREAGAAGQPALLTDLAGHSRDVYYPLVLHLYLAAYRRRYEALSADLREACIAAVPDAAAPARAVESHATAAPLPGETPMVLWWSLCVLGQARVLGSDSDVELVDRVVGAIVHRQGPQGALHPQVEGESLDAWTYRELFGLHALTDIALARWDQVWTRRVAAIAAYHLENTQPDHTTTQPWGLFAFLWTPPTRSLGEQQLHDLTVQTGGGAAGSVSGGGGESGGGGALMAGLLLADAADALINLGA